MRQIGKQQLSYLQIIDRCSFNYMPTEVYSSNKEKAKNNFTAFLDYLKKDYKVVGNKVELNLGEVEFKNVKE